MAGGGGAPQQQAVVTGPTIQAAQAAATAQENAAAMASQVAMQDTQSAIQALMGEYGTALTYAQPSINTGNQALAQLNYMLGLPAVAPGAAPTAPVAPTLADAEKYVSPQAINQYIMQNSTGNFAPGGNGTFVDTYNGPMPSDYKGTAAEWVGQTTSTALPTIGGQIDYTATPDYANSNNYPLVTQSAKEALAAPELQYLQDQYANNKTIYGQQLDQYNKQTDLYNRYKAMGQATPADISNIVTNLPGFQFQQNQGISSIQNAASASGLLNSGPLLQQLAQFGQGLSSTYYNNYLSQLSGVAGMGQQATNTAAQGANNVGNTTAGLLNDLGTTQANAYLAAGQAQASSYLSPAANQQVLSYGVGGGGGGGGSMLGSAGSILGGLGSLFSAF